MTSLRELQSEFLHALSAGDGHAPPLIEADGLGSARRVQVYRNNMLSSLTGALRAIYPVVDRLVGGRFFDAAARDYIARHPSRSGNLHAFGHAFADFVRGFTPAAGLPYLGDVAALEWAYHEVFHAAPAAALDLARLAEIEPAAYPRLRFSVAPACRVLESVYPVLRIWQVNQDGFDGAADVDLDSGGERVLVARPELDVELHTLSAGEFVLLSRLRDGAHFEQACDAALDAQPDVALDGALARFTVLKAISGFDLDPEPGPAPARRVV